LFSFGDSKSKLENKFAKTQPQSLWKKSIENFKILNEAPTLKTQKVQLKVNLRDLLIEKKIQIQIQVQKEFFFSCKHARLNLAQ
jgi:hypothetical protein